MKTLIIHEVTLVPAVGELADQDEQNRTWWHFGRNSHFYAKTRGGVSSLAERTIPDDPQSPFSPNRDAAPSPLVTTVATGKPPSDRQARAGWNGKAWLNWTKSNSWRG